MTKHLFGVHALACLLFSLFPAHADSILGSKHDLTPIGPGPIKAISETEVCNFCHTPHHAVANTPLWSHALSSQTYTLYGSSTTKAAVGQPTGSSRLCLSCHDGTVALGMVVNRPSPIPFQSGVTTLPAGDTSLATDLSDDHPISFAYDHGLVSARGQLKDPSGLTGAVRLDKNNAVQCTSCHDPHDNRFGKFLVAANTESALCLTCHDPDHWNTSTHKTSTARWNNIAPNPWPRGTNLTTVAENACGSCHVAHGAGAGPRLLHQAAEEQNCFPCHNGNVAAKNLETEFSKPSIHPVALTTGTHDPTEDPINSTRHVECVDCHNPHAVKTTGLASLTGVRGVNTSGAPIHPIAHEYELCFRCHADSGNRGPAHVNRVLPETNKRLQFATSNSSYHPVEAAGKNSFVPSLITPLTTASLIKCTDCHNNDQGPGTGGAGPAGPHGSQYPPLLERRLDLADLNPESYESYALCYKCHSRESLLSDQSFSEHRRHIVDVQAACTTCHDSHGVVATPHLINFNSTYVTNFNGRIEYQATAPRAGNCTLSCHSAPTGGITTNYYHDATSYPAGTLAPLRPRPVKPRDKAH